MTVDHSGNILQRHFVTARYGGLILATTAVPDTFDLLAYESGARQGDDHRGEDGRATVGVPVVDEYGRRGPDHDGVDHEGRAQVTLEEEDIDDEVEDELGSEDGETDEGGGPFFDVGEVG